jgi:hypothetical protein
MPTPTAIMDMVASLQNDTARTVYTDAACLPYLNMALDELQELFELNDIPTTHETSAILVCPIGTTAIGFTGGPPILPANLIELKQVWESDTGQNRWIPVNPMGFLPHYLENTNISQFQLYAWLDQEIHVLPANTIRDLKLDYIKSIFATPILIGAVATNLPIINSKSYLGYRTAALCSFFIGENETRAVELNLQAERSLDRVLGIGTKGKQGIAIRRRPFRAGFKQMSY